MTAPRDPLTALQDVVGEAEEIAGLVDGLHGDAFLGDRRTQLAVGMCFITPGNALGARDNLADCVRQPSRTQEEGSVVDLRT